MTGAGDLAGLRIATAYPGVVERYFAEHASTPRSSGSTAPWRTRSGSASPTSIADVVETGATLRQAGLETFGEPILHVVGGAGRRRAGGAGTAVTQLLRRLQGVLVARRYVMLAYDVRADAARRGRAR